MKRRSPRLRNARRASQLAVLAIVALAGFRFATGRSLNGIEQFCPFGGLETAYSLLGGGRFTCATGAGNLAILVALLALTIVAKKAFCSWVCPVGTIAEWAARLGGRIGPGRSGLGVWEPPPKVDLALRWLRLPILVALLYLTFRTGELIFRPFDPYYVIFSFHGHDVRGYSYLVILGILSLAVLVPMAWCRYLCPLGAVLWPFSRLGALRLGRSGIGCTGCGACDAACPHALPVSGSDEILSGECTLCLECTSACPRSGVLNLRTPRFRPADVGGLALPGPSDSSRTAIRRVPPVRPLLRRFGWNVPGWVVPALVVLLAVLGLEGANWIRIPSYVREYRPVSLSGLSFAGGTPEAAGSASVRLGIDGVRCVDTAERAAGQLTELPGMLRLTAFAAEHEVEIVFDPRSLDIASSRRAIEAPVYVAEEYRFLFHLFRVITIDGAPAAPSARMSEGDGPPGRESRRGESQP